MSFSKISKIIIIIFLIFSTIGVNEKIGLVHADNCDYAQNLDLLQIENCLKGVSGLLDVISNANKTNKVTLKSLQSRVNNLKDQIDGLSTQLDKKQMEINKKDKEFDKEYLRLAENVRSFYIQKYYPVGLSLLFSTQNAYDVFRLTGMYSFLTKRNRDSIVGLITLLSMLQKEKIQLTSVLNQLSGIKVQVDEQATFFAKEVAKADAAEQKLKSQIASLTARQQDILAARLAGLRISRSASAMGRCDSDLTNGRDPGFSPKIGAFTYGVPNRVGMNQYGAWGRAKAGQGYEDILKAYYNFNSIEKKDVQIRVDGHGSYSLDDYTKRIYEVPDSWTDNDLAALKAQAIAARSYALAYTNNGSSAICTTEKCQVFKPDPKGGNWEQAVNATSGLVMIKDGNPIKAWFSSTHGGYVHTSGEIGWSDTSWTKHATDTTSGSAGSFSDLQNNSFDKDSPWFYCDWGSRSQYNKTAWLKPEEFADIVNVILLAENDSGTQEHLYQTDNPPSGTDTWSSDRVKQEMKNRNISQIFNSISDIGVSVDWGSGRTTSVNVSGDAGSKSFDGSEFKNFFNLRAPANIQIVGPLFNIEKK